MLPMHTVRRRAPHSLPCSPTDPCTVCGRPREPVSRRFRTVVDWGKEILRVGLALGQ